MVWFDLVGAPEPHIMFLRHDRIVFKERKTKNYIKQFFKNESLKC